MQFARISEQQSYDGLLAYNRRFWAGEIEIHGLYELLERHNLDYRQCVLAAIHLEGGDTCSGLLIAQGRQVVEFELDPDDPNYTSLQIVPVPDPDERPGAAKTRSWEWMAWRYYDDLLQERP